jgi:transposase
MKYATLIGVDLAKNVFQVHGVDDAGNEVFHKRLSRPQFVKFIETHSPCIVAMEACGTSHFWGRAASDFGHEPRLLPPVHVKPFKNDSNDARAIVEAALRPGIHPVPVKTAEQQAGTMLFRQRDLVIKERTEEITSLRGHMAEFGIVAAPGIRALPKLFQSIEEAELPKFALDLARAAFKRIARLNEDITALDKKLSDEARTNKTVKRLQTMPGIGPVGAMAIVSFAPQMSQFSCGRDFSAWLGLVPKQRSSGNKIRMGRCTKMSQYDIRGLLIIGAMARIAAFQRHKTKPEPLLADKLERKPRMLAAVALANKMARQVWAMIVKEQAYLTLADRPA